MGCIPSGGLALVARQGASADAGVAAWSASSIASDPTDEALECGGAITRTPYSCGVAAGAVDICVRAARARRCARMATRRAPRPTRLLTAVHFSFVRQGIRTEPQGGEDGFVALCSCACAFGSKRRGG